MDISLKKWWEGPVTHISSSMIFFLIFPVNLLLVSWKVSSDILPQNTDISNTSYSIFQNVKKFSSFTQKISYFIAADFLFLFFRTDKNNCQLQKQIWSFLICCDLYPTTSLLGEKGENNKIPNKAF